MIERVIYTPEAEQDVAEAYSLYEVIALRTKRWRIT